MRKQQQLWSKLFVIVTTMDLFEGCSYQSNRKSLFIEENLHKQVLIKGNCFLFQTHLINISFIKTLRLFFDFISTLDQLFIQRLTHTLVVYVGMNSKCVWTKNMTENKQLSLCHINPFPFSRLSQYARLMH